MPHARKSIRDAVAALIVAADTEVGTSVYVNRATSVWQSELPAILIYSGPEEARPRALNSSQSIRTMELRIELKIEANETIDDDLDALALEVETVMSANQTLGLAGTVTSIVYKGNDPTITSEGETEIGVSVMNYEVQYIQ